MRRQAGAPSSRLKATGCVQTLVSVQHTGICPQTNRTVWRGLDERLHRLRGTELLGLDKHGRVRAPVSVFRRFNRVVIECERLSRSIFGTLQRMRMPVVAEIRGVEDNGAVEERRDLPDA